jgi:tetratricopeptide (TPR) repeat protein
MRMPQKKYIIFAGIILVVIGASATAAYYLSQQQVPQSSQSNDQPDDTVDGLPQKTAADIKGDEAQKLVHDGDLDAGIKLIDKAIEETTDPAEKITYNSEKATILYNNGKKDQALPAAIAAYDIAKSSDSAAFVGQIAREMGNTALALEYYKKALEHIDKTDPFWDEDTDYYNGIIVELEGAN